MDFSLTGHILAFSSNYVSQILMVLYTSLPSDLHLSHHEDSAGSCVSNVELVVELSTTVFSSDNCWRISHSGHLLHALFLLLCPRDVLLEPLQDSDEELMDQCVLPDKLISQVRTVAFSALRRLAENAALLDNGSAVQEQLSGFLKKLFEYISSLLSSDECTYSGTSYLAAITSQCLLIISETAADQDFEIPLDQTVVRDALTLLLPTEGSLAAWETRMCADYIVPSSVFSSINFRKCSLPTELQVVIYSFLWFIFCYLKGI